MTERQSAVLSELHYFGNILYYSNMLKYDTFIIEKHENYCKGSFRNRCCIATSGGILSLSIPLKKGKHQQSPIRDVLIDYSQDWQTNHWRSIKTAYNSSPYFIHYEGYFQKIFQQKTDYLFDFCLNAQELILQLLNLNPSITFTDNYHKIITSNTKDMRSSNIPKNYDTFLKSYNYIQVFEDILGFKNNLSILDLIFCIGPESSGFLKSIIK